LGMIGYTVYGLFHHEPLGLKQQIKWHRDKSEPEGSKYYAAQANAFRVFIRGEFKSELESWRVLRLQRLASLSYVMAGGLRKKQMYPTAAYRMMKWTDGALNLFPWLFATRMLVVLEKKED